MSQTQTLPVVPITETLPSTDETLKDNNTFRLIALEITEGKDVDSIVRTRSFEELKTLSDNFLKYLFSRSNRKNRTKLKTLRSPVGKLDIAAQNRIKAGNENFAEFARSLEMAQGTGPDAKSFINMLALREEDRKGKEESIVELINSFAKKAEVPDDEEVGQTVGEGIEATLTGELTKERLATKSRNKSVNSLRSFITNTGQRVVINKHYDIKSAPKISEQNFEKAREIFQKMNKETLSKFISSYEICYKYYDAGLEANDFVKKQREEFDECNRVLTEINGDNFLSINTLSWNAIDRALHEKSTFLKLRHEALKSIPNVNRPNIGLWYVNTPPDELEKIVVLRLKIVEHLLYMTDDELKKYSKVAEDYLINNNIDFDEIKNKALTDLMENEFELIKILAPITALYYSISLLKVTSVVKQLHVEKRKATYEKLDNAERNFIDNLIVDDISNTDLRTLKRRISRTIYTIKKSVSLPKKASFQFDYSRSATQTALDFNSLDDYVSQMNSNGIRKLLG